MIMKKIILVILLLWANVVLAQSWSDPVRLTDTTSFNTNPVVAVEGEGYDGKLIMFYEKQFSFDSPKQIWMRKISEPMENETVVLADDMAEFINPILLSNNFLIFESNANGNFDIHGIKFDESGNFNEPFQLTNTPGDEKSLFTSDWSGCWEYEGKIIVSEFAISGDTLQFAEPDTLATGDCHNPVCIANYAAWLKIENSESHIYSSSKEYPSYQWSDPDTVFAEGNNINLRISNSVWGAGQTLCWENADSILFLGNINYPDPVFSPHFTGIEHYNQPASFNLDFITDLYLILYSFRGGPGELTDIYIVDEIISSEPINITNDPEYNSNPILFLGRMFPYSYEVLNIWQTHINGFNALYKSDTQYLWGSVSEKKSKNQLSLQVSPNPFSDEIKIEFNLSEIQPYTLEIFNISGEKIKQMSISSGLTGKQSVIWNPNKEEIFLSDGIYFVKLVQGDKSAVMKIIHSKH